MTKRFIAIILVITTLLCLYSCSEIGPDSTFRIYFIDVGQGDSALVECDGHYMLIDGGNHSAGDKVYNMLEERGVRKLDILAVSHYHADHIGGLARALTYTSSIRLTISNSKHSDIELFEDFEHALQLNGSKIQVPAVGDVYKLGSATVEVVYLSDESENDSLVLLITYGNTRFLFTGDIEGAAQARISGKYHKPFGKPYKIDLIKMPHHGVYTDTLDLFLQTFMPDYAVISVGVDNSYGHPHQDTLDLLNRITSKPKLLRTDTDGNITIKSNGKNISVQTSE